MKRSADAPGGYVEVCRSLLNQHIHCLNVPHVSHDVKRSAAVVCAHVGVELPSGGEVRDIHVGEEEVGEIGAILHGCVVHQLPVYVWEEKRSVLPGKIKFLSIFLRMGRRSGVKEAMDVLRMDERSSSASAVDDFRIVSTFSVGNIPSFWK